MLDPRSWHFEVVPKHAPVCRTSFPRKSESRIVTCVQDRAPAAGAQRCEHRQRGRTSLEWQAAGKCRSASNTMPFSLKSRLSRVRGLQTPSRTLLVCNT